MNRVALLAFCLAIAACASDPPPVKVVFFTQGSTTLDAAARNVVQEAAGVANNTSGPVRVLGYAVGRDTPNPANDALAPQRAQAVANALIAQGVLADRIRLENRGAVPFEQVPVESRRVEIRVGR